MSKDKLTDYSATAGSNTDIGGININEGMLPSNVNNALREQMSHLADFAAGTTGIDVLNLQDDDASHSIKIQAPASVTATTTFTLPDGDGSANQSLVTNGSGALSFSTRLANVVEDTTPQLGGNLDVNGNDINFGDNDKAVFGAGSDLQIYHDGSGSFVSDQGVGALKLLSGGVRLKDPTDTTSMLVANSGGAVTLYYDNASKIATAATGVDVTGTITSDGLTVDGAGVIRLNPSSGDDFLTLTQGGTQAVITADSTAGAGNLVFRTTSAGSDTDTMLLAANGDISFYDSTGVTQGLFWDASTQRLGLGTTSPSFKLTVKDSSSAMAFLDSGGTAVLALDGANGDFSGADYYQIEADGSSNFNISLAGTPRLTIASGGNVGIGTSSLENWDSSWVATQVGSGSSLVSASGATSRTFLSDNAYADGSNQLTSWKYMSTNEASLYAQLDGTHSFRVASSGTADTAITWSEAMVIDSSGTVTATAFVGDGSGLTGIGGAVGLTDVGSFIMARATTASALNAGATLSGSSLVYANAYGQGPAGSVGVGTWRVHGYVNTANNEQLTTVWQRIS